VRGRGLSEYPEGITSPQDFKGPQEQPHFVMRILPRFARVIVTWNLGHCACIRDVISREQKVAKVEEDRIWAAKV
jgi:hypothetical protein